MSYRLGESGDQSSGESTVKEKSLVVKLCVVAPPDPPRGLTVISTDVVAFVEVVIDPLTWNKKSAELLVHRCVQCTFAIHIGIEVQVRNIVCRRRFDPHTLPNTAAGCIEDMRWM